MRNDMQPPWRSPAAPYRALDGQRIPRPPPPPSRRPAQVTRSVRSTGRGPQRNPNVSAAAAYSTGMSSSAPAVSRSGNDSCRIVHRELLSNVSGSSAYTVGLSFPLNPGLAVSFPWLSTQAQSWEQYRFNKLRFCYYTRTASTTPGSVMLIPDYDAADAAPATEQIASSYGEVVEDSPWKDLCCNLRPDRMHSMGPKKFVRSLPLTANLDIKTYDVGSLFVATTDGTAVPWGKIWVEYDITLFVPQLQPLGEQVSLTQHSIFSSSTSAAIFGGTQTNLPGSASFATFSANVISFRRAGRYLVTVAVDPGTSATTLLASGGGLTTVTPVASYGLISAGVGLQNPMASTTGDPAGNIIYVDALIGQVISYNSTIVGGGSAEVFICLVNVTQA